MPEYLAPGVYVEEVSFRAKLIEGVSTSTTGFVGPTRFGPTSGVPELVTSLAEFQRKFGLLEQLNFSGDDPSHNYLAHGARGFFENGGQRLYVSRTYRAAQPDAATPLGVGTGCAYYTLGGGSFPATLLVQARFPGLEGDLPIGISFKVSENVLLRDATVNLGDLRGVRSYDVVWVQDVTSTQTNPLQNTGTLYWAERKFDESRNLWTWLLHSEGDASTIDFTQQLTGSNDVGEEIRVVTAAVEVVVVDRDAQPVRRELWDGLAFDPRSKAAITSVFARRFDSPSQGVEVPIIIDCDGGDGATVARVLLEATEPDLSRYTVGAGVRSLTIRLAHGSDGERPNSSDYGGDDTDPTSKTGLTALEDITDISIIAAPGYSSDPDLVQVQAVANMLISHAERMRYRIAVLDSQENRTLTDVRQFRAKFDSKHAALYYPWVRILDPITEQEIHLPPSGFVCGIYARNDIERGVHKAPANEVVRLATSFEFLINKAQQDVLNPEHINVLRYLPGRGYRIWGARTITSDPEWKYVNLRRYFAFLEASIERGTQWAVFEPNGDELWTNVRRTVDDFLFNEWRSGHLLGVTPDEAYFVRCDRTTMTQNDLDNGRMVCLIGVSPLRPAEFVIFRIGQWTADRRE
jgi:Bacteriophage tail sheath protein